MERIKRHLRSAAGYLLVCAKWLALAALVGCVVGPLGAAFAGSELGQRHPRRTAVAAVSAACGGPCHRISVRAS